jgi:predicted GNAT family N-acyltransferase
MECRVATLDEIIALRAEVIIAGTGRDSPYFEGDDAPETVHVGAFDAGTGACIGCATFLRSSWEGAPAWKLRGMATAPGSRRRGAGRALLACAEGHLRAISEVDVLWCNAREAAAGFYERLGWQRVGEAFDVPGVGIHYRMTTRLGAGPTET